MPGTMLHQSQSADIVIIGGGIIGTSIAYHLARMGAGKIVLLERESLLGTGSTGRCAGGFRLQFSTEINIRLSLLSRPMILGFAQETGWEVDIHQDGYLFLLSKPEDVHAFRANVALQNRLGAPSQYLEAEEIAVLAPHISLAGILGGTFCPKEGIGDPNGMTQGYAAAARRRGVRVFTDTRATGIRRSRGKTEGVETNRGYLPCGAIVNAAGPDARVVASWAGIDLPVFPQRRHVYATHPFAQAPCDHMMVIDFSTTFYFHRESGGILMGMGDPKEPASFNLDVDPNFLDRVLETGLERYPALADAAINRAWAGLYEMSPDAHPILGRAEGAAGFYLANGFSGHGFQHAPIVGKLLAEEILTGSAQTLDLAPLRLDRFRSRLPSRELNVV
jgi:sarcosine oxidase, subunit beta